MGKIASPFSKKAFTDPLGLFDKNKASTDTAPITNPVPPTTTTDPEVVQAGVEQRKAEGRKRGVRSMIMAGDTGGFRPMTSPTAGAPNASRTY